MAEVSTDADEILWAELRRAGIASLSDVDEVTVVDLVLRYAIWLPVDTYNAAPWLAPYAIRRLRVRADPRAPGPKRDLWGLPDENGYFADDNSLIKGVTKDMHVSPGSPYRSSKVGRGLVCCHVWPGTTTNPLLFSFVPNLVWLPRSLAGYSDAHLAGSPHQAHEVLKAVSTNRFRGRLPSIGGRRAAVAWQGLPVPGIASGSACFEFATGERVAKLARKRTVDMIEFLSATLADGDMPRRFSKRYHAGVGPRIDLTVWPVQRAVSAEARRTLIESLRSCLEPTDDAQIHLTMPRDVAVADDQKPVAVVDVPTASFAAMASDELKLAPVSEAELAEFGAWLVRTRRLTPRPVADYQSRVRRVAKGVDLSTLTPAAQASLKSAVRAFTQFRSS